MSAARVDRDIAKHILGHKQQGVEATYDRHSYVDEKADALERLAGRIRDITAPPPANVSPLRKIV